MKNYICSDMKNKGSKETTGYAIKNKKKIL